MTPRAIDEAAADPSEVDTFLRYAQQLERDHPGYLASMGMTAEQYARGMAGPAMTVEESVEAGWMCPAEGRYLCGQATLEDLLELGHSPEEARAMLEEQREQACASSA